jgi:hypothetical protein
VGGRLQPLAVTKRGSPERIIMPTWLTIRTILWIAGVIAGIGLVSGVHATTRSAHHVYPGWRRALYLRSVGLDRKYHLGHFSRPDIRSSR